LGRKTIKHTQHLNYGRSFPYAKHELHELTGRKRILLKSIFYDQQQSIFYDQQQSIFYDQQQGIFLYTKG
jgi:flagellar biosynthesis/type III secretory pathway chaperone